MSKSIKTKELESSVMELRDILDDIVTGLEAWKREKISSMEWTTHDEMLARWIEAGPLDAR